MKKLVFVFMGILIALVSCKKSEDFAAAQKEEIKIFFKSPDSSQLKSGSVDIQVKSGDTINAPINVNAIVYAEDANGKAVKVNWGIYSIKNDNPTNLFTDLQPDSQGVDQASLIFPEYGIYKVSATKENLQFDFFVKVFGIPGKIGDESGNNFIFRLEKKNLTVVGGNGAKHRLLFIYYKFANTNWLDRKPQAYLSIYRNLQRTSTTRDLLKWPFSKDKNDNYYYFILDLEKSADLGDYYEAGFEIAESNGGFGDDNAHKSSWSNGTSIKFFIPSIEPNGQAEVEVPISAGELSNVSMEQTEKYLFVANKDDGRIYVFTNNADHKLVKTFAVEGNPSQLLFYRDYPNNLSVILVPLSNMKKIKVIDVTTLKLRADIATPKMPYFLAADTDKIFATVSRNNGSDYDPFMIWFTADRPYGSTIQTTWGNNNSFSGNEQIMVDAPNRAIYIGNRGYSPDNISKYKIISSASVEFVKENDHGSLGSNGIQFIFDRDKNKIYLASGSGGTHGYNLQVVNPTDLTKVADLSIGSYPNAVGFDTNYIYAGKDAYYDDGDITVFDRSSYASVRSYSFDQSETLVARGISANWSVYAATNKYIYYLNTASSVKTKIFDFTTGRPLN